ncbi:MAG: phosphatidylglycerol lysyltransferase domain-containing protein [Treponema sp.]|nr:phosphatidylglycerol lysyltransferase domain-containing protein [Treponema sp.]
MTVPQYPEFAPLSLEHKSEMHPKLSLTPDGVSEFTFPCLFLFRQRYQYRVSNLEGKTFIISGTQPPPEHEEGADSREGKKFFMTPCAAPGRGVIQELFKTHDYWKNISDSVLIPNREKFEECGIEFTEDRDNFDYLYLRTDLAELPGKKYHKKRNLVAQFLKTYSYEKKPITLELVPHAMKVLETWRADKGTDGDYWACKEALDRFGDLNMKGILIYVEGKPVGWCLGEPIARGRIFTVHIEKGLESYKGIYQFLNQAFAATLPEYFTHINREQDLGDEGMRQAKMTYRPSGFVRKYKGQLKG